MEFVSRISFDYFAWLLWKTDRDFMFEWRGTYYVIPYDFVLDMFSTPFFLWWYMPPEQDGYNEAALIHDFLRRFRKLFDLSVADTDAAFRDALIKTKMPKFKRVRKYRWVRIFALFTAGKGNGKPGRKVRKAMAAKGLDWNEYRERVIEANGL